MCRGVSRSWTSTCSASCFVAFVLNEHLFDMTTKMISQFICTSCVCVSAATDRRVTVVGYLISSCPQRAYTYTGHVNTHRQKTL